MEKKAKTDRGSWSDDRYYSLLIQRNALFVLSLLALIAILTSTFMSTKLISSKTLEPFIVEVDDRSGIVTVVQTETHKNFSSDDAVNNYFLLKYIKARELYNPYSYKYLYNTVVRSFSAANVYREAVLQTRRSPDSMMNRYSGRNVSMNLKVRSIQYIDYNTVQIRFTIEVTSSASGEVYKHHKISYIVFEYKTVAMNEIERYENPLGFTIISYNVSDEVID